MTLAKSLQSAAGNAAGEANYIEDVFSTYLFVGNDATLQIQNGINLAEEGGLIWEKTRNEVATWNLYDTERGVTKRLMSNNNFAEQTSTALTSFNTNGVTLGSGDLNYAGYNHVLFSFRKQPKFFDVVTWTGNSTTGRSIPHNLGSVPGCIIIKSTNNVPDWHVWHRELTNPLKYLTLNNTDPAYSGSAFTAATPPDATSFNLTASGLVNQTGQTYVAYLFAHNAGGFGLSGEDNVISCGSYTGTGVTGLAVTLGYEPQWVMIKQVTSGGGGWGMVDVMRGMNGVNSRRLLANSSSDEGTTGLFNVGSLQPTATGFTVETNDESSNGAGQTYIYIAIRRGPMKVPESGTSVFSPITSSVVTGTKNTTGFPVDLQLQAARGVTHNTNVVDRLRGASSTDTQSAARLITNDVNAEGTSTTARGWDNTGFLTPSGFSNVSLMYWNFRRAPGFFDEVCYTSGVTDPTTLTLNHNLGVVPQMMIKKARQTNGVSNTWRVYHIGLNGGINPQNGVIRLDSSGVAQASSPDWGNTAPTATQFTAGYVESGISYVTYLFATCPGVSKVGSYTGTGTTQQINCGFTGGARFVLIKRTDSTGDWYVWDTARGIVAGNDPYLLINSTAAEVTSTDYIDTYSAGFEISSTAPAAINASGGTFIFFAVS